MNREPELSALRGVCPAAVARRALTVTVIVPTWRRPADLVRCLHALATQTRAPNEVIVVMRDIDDATRECFASPSVVTLAASLPLRIAIVEVPGQVAALNGGLDAASGDIVAITDDDAAPRRDWVERIGAAFEADAALGAIGGRDWVHEQGRVIDGERTLVGKLTRSGKIIGNHHLGAGGAREVDLLKGANMSYRRAALDTIRFDARLRGAGAQVHNDMAFSMAVRHAGWKLVYDPRVANDHFPAERFDDDQRGAQSLVALTNAAFNLHLILGERLSPRARLIAWWWYALVGTRVYPGLAHVVLAFGSARFGVNRARFLAVRGGAREARRELASTASATPALR